MSSPESWQADLSFSERMAITIKIAASYKVAFPEYITPETQVQARLIETAIHKDALSKEDYYQRCKDKIDQYNHLARPLNGEEISEPNSTANEAQEPGQKIGPYPSCIHHTTGLFSTIYRTQQSTPNGLRTLALKLTIPSQCQPPHNPKREARILLAAKHPNVIPLLEAHTLPSSHFLLVFPFMHLDLETLLHQKDLSKQQAREIVRDLFAAIAHLHSLGIIHRDIKPSNILLASVSGPAYLADFGIVWSPNDPASEPANQKITDVGTTCYRPPELLFGHKAYGCSVDLWAAGCVVAEIVTSTTIAPNDQMKRGEWTLFNAGELGSELALVKSIFETLGTPTEDAWPESSTLPDWNKMSFVAFPPKPWTEILPDASDEARGLVAGLVRFQSTERMGAAEVWRHTFVRGDGDEVE